MKKNSENVTLAAPTKEQQDTNIYIKRANFM